MKRYSQLFLPLTLVILLSAQKARAVAYFEAGTSLGVVSNGLGYFGQSTAQSTSKGFLGSLSFYVPVTSERKFFHFELGVQNRFLTAGTAAFPLAMATQELGLRLQLSRFYVGGGYAPLAYVSKAGSGISSLHLNPGASAYFAETGAIWRVIPEFQIVAIYAIERGLPKTGGLSPTLNEVGLRFRFPINPTENARGSGVDFDGFRYPFGFMK